MIQMPSEQNTQNKDLTHIFNTQLLELVNKLLQIQNNKQQFAEKTLNHQIRQLFKLLSPYPTISSSEIPKVLIESSVASRMLIQNKKQMTVNDLQEYLGVTMSTQRRQHKSIEIQHKYQLIDYLGKEAEIFEEIQRLFSCVFINQPQLLFDSIDQQQNGYISPAALGKYLRRVYCQKEQSLGSHGQAMNLQLEKICRWIIKFLKNSIAASKIYFKDFMEIIEENSNVKQAKENMEGRDNCSSRLVDKLLVGKITRVTHLPYTLIPRINKNPTPIENNQEEQQMLLDEQLDEKCVDLGSGRITMEGLKKENEIETIIELKDTSYSDRLKETQKVFDDISRSHEKNPSYEARLSLTHPRNRKFLQKLAKSSRVVIDRQLPCVDPTNKRYIPPQIYLKKSQIIYQWRYLANLYHQHYILVNQLIRQHPKFTFVNAFNVIDWREKQQISYGDLLQFTREANIIVYDKKLKIFYDFLVGFQTAVDFCSFTKKIFSLKSNRYLFKECRKRRPLFTEKWDESQKKAYCNFLREIIGLFNQRSSAAQLFLSMFSLESASKQAQLKQFSEKLYSILENEEINHQQLVQILGINAQYLITEIYNQQNASLDPEYFYDFLQALVLKGN